MEARFARSVVATDIAERCLPELRLTMQIIHTQNDRTDAEHFHQILAEIANREPDLRLAA